MLQPVNYDFGDLPHGRGHIHLPSQPLRISCSCGTSSIQSALGLNDHFEQMRSSPADLCSPHPVVCRAWSIDSPVGLEDCTWPTWQDLTLHPSACAYLLQHFTHQGACHGQISTALPGEQNKEGDALAGHMHTVYKRAAASNAFSDHIHT